jgi:hypothetical protein
MRILSHFWASDRYGISDADAFDLRQVFMARAYQNEDKIGDIIVDKVLFLRV